MKRNGYTLLQLLMALGGAAVSAVIFFPVVGRVPDRSPRITCRSNLKQIGLGFLQYAQDYDEKLPPIALSNTALEKQSYGWADALQPYLKSTQLYHCPAENAVPESSDPTQRGYTDYWFNAHLDAQPMRKILVPTTTFLAGEGNDGRDLTNARYARRALPLRWLDNPQSPSQRHDGEANYLFADGHVKNYLPDSVFLFENAP